MDHEAHLVHTSSLNAVTHFMFTRISDVLTHVEPTTETGRTYRSSTEETRKVEEIMQTK